MMNQVTSLPQHSCLLMTRGITHEFEAHWLLELYSKINLDMTKLSGIRTKGLPVR